MAAACAVVGADNIVYWWMRFIARVASGGASAYPSRIPVIAYAFENPSKTTVRSRIPGSEAIEVWSPSYTSSA